MKDKYFVLSLGVGFSFRGQQVMRAFGRDMSIYNIEALINTRKKFYERRCRTTNVPQITRTLTKITIKLEVNFCCYEDVILYH